MSATDFKKQVWEMKANLSTLVRKREIAVQSKNTVAEVKANMFIIKKEQKNKEYIAFLKTEQEKSVKSNERKLSELRAILTSTEQKIVSLQASIEEKAKYYSDKFAALIRDEISPPPCSASVIVARIDAEIADLQSRILFMEKSASILEITEQKALFAEQEIEVSRRRATFRAELAEQKRKEKEEAEYEKNAREEARKEGSHAYIMKQEIEIAKEEARQAAQEARKFENILTPDDLIAKGITGIREGDKLKAKIADEKLKVSKHYNKLKELKAQIQKISPEDEALLEQMKDKIFKLQIKMLKE